MSLDVSVVEAMWSNGLFQVWFDVFVGAYVAVDVMAEDECGVVWEAAE